MAVYRTEKNSFSRRNLVLGGVQIGLFAGLIGRLQYLQISQAEAYTTLANANRINVSPILAPRGRITDRYGELLAENNRNLSVEIVPERVRNLSRTLSQLQAILNLSNGQMQKVIKDISRKPKFKATVVAQDLPWKSFSKLNTQLPFLPGVEPIVGEKRVYTHGQATAHLIGYVAPKTLKDIQKFGDVANEFVGQTGVEREFEEDLRGVAGARHVEVNVRGRQVRELSSSPGAAGQDLQLTIDIDLQAFAAKRLGDRSATAVVMDVTNGDVLCMVSSPSFDPNQLSRGIDMKSWEAMLKHERKPFLNKVTRGLYAPGSTFKMIVALAALEAGVVTHNEEINCTGLHEYGNELYHCWRSEGHGPLNLRAALEQSCDVFFYDIAVRTGIDRIEAMAKRFGLGSPTGIGFGAEKSGTMPGRDWKRANYDTGWRGGETVITAIGQGFVLTTPLQLVAMTAALANQGVYVRPRISMPAEEAATGERQIDKADLGINARHMKLVQAGMYGAVNRPDGTAYASSLLVDGHRMSGKTGTVQVRRISMAERELGVIANTDLDWHLRDHALFVGYAPHKNQRYAISVVVEHGGGGASIAAPRARDSMVHLLRQRPPAGGVS